MYDSLYNEKKWENGSKLNVGYIVELSYTNSEKLEFELNFKKIDECLDKYGCEEETELPQTTQPMREDLPKK